MAGDSAARVGGQHSSQRGSQQSAQLGGPLAGLGPGSRVAGYLLGDLVGVGGMAVVFRAHDEALGRTVALKVLAGNLAGDQAARQRFTREARTVANVEHPHIIPVYAAGQADGLLYIAMRFVDGADLHALIHRDGPLPPKRAAAFVSDMASALDAAHAVGVVHRDVKPANVLVDTRPGRPEHGYLTDFGVARVMRSTGGLTIAGQFIGTPNYGAPEQINGTAVDGRTDQYALACVAYELLTGSVPFKREDPMMVLYAHAYTPPPLLTAARPDLSAAVDAVLAQGLAKQPGQRYDTCGDFADALREALGLDPYDPRRAVRPGTATTALPPATVLLPEQPPPTKTMTLPELPAPRPPAPTSLAPNVTGTWTAVVTADHSYYESVRVADAADEGTMSFPAHLAERRIPLTGDEVRIGRRSSKSPHQPEIDLTGPPLDPGVSRQHAELRRSPDGSWSVIDLGSPNGIQVNGKDVPSGTLIPILPGDQIHLGAWTLITLTRG
jgi:serine/threonine protein kinase